jgi:hypothetical protein
LTGTISFYFCHFSVGVILIGDNFNSSLRTETHVPKVVASRE